MHSWGLPNFESTNVGILRSQYGQIFSTATFLDYLFWATYPGNSTYTCWLVLLTLPLDLCRYSQKTCAEKIFLVWIISLQGWPDFHMSISIDVLNQKHYDHYACIRSIIFMIYVNKFAYMYICIYTRRFPVTLFVFSAKWPLERGLLRKT